jgi:hypothetical protein
MRNLLLGSSPAPQSLARDRRGVLLVVVLSMLALFLLLGTAFLMTSSFYRDSTKASAKKDRTTNDPTSLNHRAMQQALRGTNNPNSTLSIGDSLLGDVYGDDGFEARVFVPADNTQTALMPQYAGATLTNPPTPLGPTNGQFIDLFVQDLDWLSMVGSNSSLVAEFPQADPRFVVKLRRDPQGRPIDHALEPATGYHNGSLLTFTSGPVKGQTARIVDYRYVGNHTGSIMVNGTLTPVQNRPVWRIRIMTVSRSDGAPVSVRGNSLPARSIELADLVENPSTYLGVSFVVNGRPFNGTGAGFNPLAQPGTPRLNATELVQVTPSEVIGMEIALLPNRRFIDLDRVGVIRGAIDPFRSLVTANLNAPSSTDPVTLFNGPGGPSTGLYSTPEGPGGSDESYDAVDFQNIFLARVPLFPQERAGVLTTTSLQATGGVPISVDSPDAIRVMQGNEPTRCDVENMIIPSYHRPDLAYYWFHRTMNSQWFADAVSDENLRALASFLPYGPNGVRGDADDPNGVPIAIRDQLAALKRKFIMRPSMEDHPDFDGSNALSRYDGALFPVQGGEFALNGQIRFPIWETIGPWDVDNDNDGIRDSVWIDTGEPVRETEEGQLYKPLAAFLIIDLDNRLNLNAHGSVDHLVATPFDPTAFNTNGNVGNLAGGGNLVAGTGPVAWSSNLMPHGMGWGPGDITLRRILSPNLPFVAPNLVGDTNYDDYARLFAGRPAAGPNDSTTNMGEAMFGRLGSQALTGRVRPGRNFDIPSLSNRDALTPFETTGMPVTDPLRAERIARLQGPSSPWWRFSLRTGYGSMPDLHGKYAMGIDYTGQPVAESIYDWGTSANRNDPTTWTFVPLVDDSPYETDLSAKSRRGMPRLDAVRNFATNTPTGQPDDAPFAVAEMERLLRAHDPETGTAPSRLWELVDAFDPQKYALAIDGNVQNAVSPAELALAEVATSANRQQVTTDSYEIPAPSEVVPSYITELGPDGAPGNVGVDDDQTDSDFDGNPVDDVAPFNPATGVGEVGWYATEDPRNLAAGLYLTGWSDDFASLTGKSVSQARLSDVLWYRIQRNRIDRHLPPLNFNNPAAVAELDNICQQLLPPEVLAGYKMDLNRPFGDGRDNNANGVVDEPLEAGEPYWDLNGDGRWSQGEPFIDMDGDGRFYGDIDGNGVIEDGPGQPDRIYFDDNGDGTPDRNESPFDTLWTSEFRGAGIPMDAVFGTDVSGPVFFDTNNNGVLEPGETVAGNTIPNVRDDAHMARALYARHLYVMMLLMMDEDYVAPHDPNDPQVLTYIRVKGRELRNADPALKKEESEIIARRKYTYRLVAQWAVNCVDFRDADVSMTAFEYDENPWDGWGNIDYGADPLDPTGYVYYPLDGDPATDENHRQFINWQAMRDAAANNPGQKIVTPPVATTANRLSPRDANRNVVWGAERPELLMTETFAVHDMRLEDLRTANTTGDNTTYDDSPPNLPRDEELDQRLRPRGSAFVELYNPWSADSGANELYTQLEKDAQGRVADVNGNGRIDIVNSEGVELGRLSTIADRNGKRSPVWRIIVVEEEPTYRNYDNRNREPVTRDNQASHIASANNMPEYYNIGRAGGFKPTDMDWDEMLSKPSGNVRVTASQWQQESTRSENVELEDPQGNPVTTQRALFGKPYPYIEREFYFNSNDSFWAYDRTGNDATNSNDTLRRGYTYFRPPQLGDIYNNKLKVKIPFNYVKIADGQRRSLTFRFLATPRVQPGPNARRIDARIAGVMPGRYAVLGAAGVAYVSPEHNVDLATDASDPNRPSRPRFITTFGRVVRGDLGNPQTTARTLPDVHLKALQGTRRIELCPSPDPHQNQVLVASNGAGNLPVANVGVRENELFVTEIGVQNFGDANDNAGGTPDGNIDADPAILAPAVALPVEDFNISEPVYGYEIREDALNKLHMDHGDKGMVFRQRAEGGEGAYVDAQGNEAHYDLPFDEDPELTEIGTVPNYRVFHLQRLADPTLPWNPPPGHNAWDSERPNQHDPNLPVNPYRTVDTATADLTVFNGTRSEPQNAGPETYRLQKGPYQFFRSKERGKNAEVALGTADAVPLRAVWQQERASNHFLWRNKPPRVTRPFNSVPQNIKDDQRIFANHFNYVFDHTLGFANSSFGDIYFREEAAPNTPLVKDPTDFDGDPTTVGRATGAPRAMPSVTESTYPWLTWNNRPFISQNELLQVPATSSTNLLWYYSTINSATTLANQLNGYFGSEMRDASDAFLTGLGGNPPDDGKTNVRRLATSLAPFGHLLNMFQSSTSPAIILDGANSAVPVGAPNFNRLLDYVHVPSRFTATEAMLNPADFRPITRVPGPDTGYFDPADPRRGKAAPFNFVPEYREPGKINLNTLIEQRGSSAADPYAAGARPLIWSEVWDGLMHRVQDGDPIGALGHFGPALRDVVLSRRGYVDPVVPNKHPTGLDATSLVFNQNYPTFFANPFRSPSAGDLVPLPQMVQPGVEVSMLRSHPFRPGNGYLWGSNGDDDGQGLMNATLEAGFGDDMLAVPGTPGANVPLFSELATPAAVDAQRNPGMHYMPLTRLGNLTTQRSGVFAVWVTVGYFEVKPAPSVDWTRSGGDPQAISTAEKFINQAGGDVDRAMRLYNKVYPQGYQLGKELGIDTGEVKRSRSFYIIDRTRPVGYKPGEDLNSENAILLQRRIE